MTIGSMLIIFSIIVSLIIGLPVHSLLCCHHHWSFKGLWRAAKDFLPLPHHLGQYLYAVHAQQFLAEWN